MKNTKKLIPLFLALLGLAVAAFLIGKHMNRSPLIIENIAHKETDTYIEVSADVHNNTDTDIAAQLTMKLLQKAAHGKGTYTYEPAASKLANVFVPKSNQVHIVVQIPQYELPRARSKPRTLVSEVYVTKIYDTKAQEADK